MDECPLCGQQTEQLECHCDGADSLFVVLADAALDRASGLFESGWYLGIMEAKEDVQHFCQHLNPSAVYGIYRLSRELGEQVADGAGVVYFTTQKQQPYPRLIWSRNSHPLKRADLELVSKLCNKGGKWSYE